MTFNPLTESLAPGVLSAEEVGVLIIEPLRLRSVALRTSTNVATIRPSYRFPIIAADAAAQWVPEGTFIPESQPTVDELVVTPVKVAALVSVTNELIADSAENATATGVVADGLVRKFARTLDLAFYGDTVTNGPDGVYSLDGAQSVTYDSSIPNLDVFATAISKLESVGVVCTSFAASFNTVLELALLKHFTGTFEGGATSNEPLLQSSPGDVQNPTTRTIFGVPLYAVPEGTLSDGVIVAVGAEQVFTVMRQDISVVATPFGPGFGADSVTIRATLRANYGFPQQNAVVIIAPEGS